MYHIAKYKKTGNVYLLVDVNLPQFPDTVKIIQILHTINIYNAHVIGHSMRLKYLQKDNNIELISGGEEILEIAALEAL